jgi:hypothetical protein
MYTASEGLEIMQGRHPYFYPKLPKEMDFRVKRINSLYRPLNKLFMSGLRGLKGKIVHNKAGQ